MGVFPVMNAATVFLSEHRWDGNSCFFRSLSSPAAAAPHPRSCWEASPDLLAMVLQPPPPLSTQLLAALLLSRREEHRDNDSPVRLVPYVFPNVSIFRGSRAACRFLQMNPGVTAKQTGAVRGDNAAAGFCLRAGSYMLQISSAPAAPPPKPATPHVRLATQGDSGSCRDAGSPQDSCSAGSHLWGVGWGWWGADKDPEQLPL